MDNTSSRQASGMCIRPIFRHNAYMTMLPSSLARIFILLRFLFTKMKTSPSATRLSSSLVAMPCSPQKLLRMLTGLLYSQKRVCSLRLSIVADSLDYFTKVSGRHISHDAHFDTEITLTCFNLAGVAGSASAGCSGGWHCRRLERTSRNQLHKAAVFTGLVLIAISLLSPIELPEREIQLRQTLLVCYIMGRTVLLN